MRYRLIAPTWLRSIISPPYTLEGEFSDDFLTQKNLEGWNIYWMPNGPSQSYPQGYFVNGRHIDQFNYIFVDCDLKDGQYSTKEEFWQVVLNFPLKPTYIVDSGNGSHVYWEIENLTREWYVELQLRLIQQFQTDDSVWTVMQLLRVPGTYNTKERDNFKECKIVYSAPTTYTVEQFHEHLPLLTDESIQKAKAHLDRLDGKTDSDIATENIDLEQLPYKFVIMLDKNQEIKELFTDPVKVCGDRSTADMKLCNKLFNRDFSKQDAFRVIYNTIKAKSRRGDREEYAWNIVDKVYTDRPRHLVPNAAERNKNPANLQLGEYVNGTPYFDDVLVNRWRKKQVLGLIGGSKAGKTSVSLKILYDMATRNQNDDIFIFFSLEMTESEILEKWNALTAGNEKICERLYIVANEDDMGEPRHIGLQEIYRFSVDISKYTGKAIGAIVIDHVGVISNRIDITKRPHFDAASSKDAGFGTEKHITLEFMCSKFKELAKMLNCFLIIQSQTTKDKAGEGDIPIGISGAYGVSQFEWYCDYVMSIWQPLKRIYSQTNLRVTAWWYCGIRNKHKDDIVKEYVPYLLYYDLATGNFRPITEDEEAEFNLLISQANALRDKMAKKQMQNYTNTPVIEEASRGSDFQF